VAYALLALWALLIQAFFIFKAQGPQIYAKYAKALDIVLLTRACVKFSVDIFMIFKFKALFSFFIVLKYQRDGGFT